MVAKKRPLIADWSAELGGRSCQSLIGYSVTIRLAATTPGRVVACPYAVAKMKARPIADKPRMKESLWLDTFLSVVRPPYILGELAFQFTERISESVKYHVGLDNNALSNIICY